MILLRIRRDKMKCEYCFRKIEEGERYCENCGKRVNKKEEQPVEQSWNQGFDVRSWRG